MRNLLSLFFVAALAAQALAFDDIKFLPAWKLDEVGRPGAIATSGWRSFVIDDKSQSLFIFDSDGKLLKSVGREGSGKDQFSSPQGLCADGRGRVYVADTGNHRIQVLDEDGKFLLSFGSKGSGPGELRKPEGVAVGEDGRVYVADTGNDRIQVFSGDGNFLFGFGVNGLQEGQMRSPTGVQVDASDFVYVLDSGNERILKFDPQTQYQSAFNLLGRAFAMDRYGYFYVLDPKVRKVREINREGTMEGAFGTRGEGNGQFKELGSLAVSPDGTVFALDPALKRVTRAVLANKLKTQVVPMNLATKLLVSGPTKSWPAKASALAATDERVYAFLAESREFAVFDKDGKIVSRFGAKTEKEGPASKDSQGMAASAQQGLFASDTNGDRLLHFDASGALVAAFAQSTGFFDSKKKEGRVKAPHGMAMTDKGALYVANTGARRVDAYNPDGTFLFSVGPELGNFELKDPVSVAWAKEGFIYILDRGLKRVFKCEPSGGYIGSWGEVPATENPPKLPSWMPAQPVSRLVDPIAVAAANAYVYVLDAGAKRIEVFSKDGEWITNYFSAGADERGLDEPAALATRGQEILVSDPGKGRILTFVLHPLLAPPLGISTSVVEGVVSLKWEPSPDAWAEKVQVLRSTASFGPFLVTGDSTGSEYKDKNVASFQTYYYRLATQAKSGDVGPASPVFAAFVPGSTNRAPVEISSVTIGDLFAANYKFYQKNPIGSLTLVNNVDVPFENVKVSFRLKGAVDFGAGDAVIPRLEGEQKAEIPLKAVLNNNLVQVTEETPVQAEFSITYFESGKERVVSLSKPLRVYSRNAIRWDRPDRIAAFITINDTPVKDFERKVLVDAATGPSSAGALSRPLRNAILLWDALGAAGMKYQPAPNNAFEAISQDPAFPIDYTQFPRETLKHKSGQCDDVATLLSSLLESASVRTALLDYPGHIALMFDTGANDPMLAGLPESELVLYQGTYWVPIEPTLLGVPFADSHRKAIAAYQEMKKAGKAAIIDPRAAWATFEPATMPPTDWTPEAPKADEISKRADADLSKIAKTRYGFLQGVYAEQLSKNPKDTDAISGMGILELESGEYDKAIEQFNGALKIDPANATALNNLGSVAFLKGEFEKAQHWFSQASEKDAQDPGIWLNLAKVSAKLKQAAKAKQFGAKAIALDSNMKPAVEALTP